MTFQAAVGITPEIQDAYHPGLQALSQSNRSHVQAGQSRKLTGSVDLDDTLRSIYPNDPRWDYAIGYQSDAENEIIYWLEIHPATDAEVRVVLQKLDWLRNWMKEMAPALCDFTGKYVWLSSGKTAFTPSGMHKKKLAQKGLIHAGQRIRLS